MNDDYECGTDVLGAEETVGFLPLIMAAVSAAGAMINPIKNLFDHSEEDAKRKAEKEAREKALKERDDSQVSKQKDIQAQMVADAQQKSQVQKQKYAPKPTAQQQAAQVQMVKAQAASADNKKLVIYGVAGASVFGLGAWLMLRKGGKK